MHTRAVIISGAFCLLERSSLLACAQALTSVDFPKPAGADMTVRGRPTASSNSANNLGLVTNFCLVGGMQDLVVRRAKLSADGLTSATLVRMFSLPFLGQYDSTPTGQA